MSQNVTSFVFDKYIMRANRLLKKKIWERQEENKNKQLWH